MTQYRNKQKKYVRHICNVPKIVSTGHFIKSTYIILISSLIAFSLVPVDRFVLCVSSIIIIICTPHYNKSSILSFYFYLKEGSRNFFNNLKNTQFKIMKKYTDIQANNNNNSNCIVSLLMEIAVLLSLHTKDYNGTNQIKKALQYQNCPKP